MATDLKEFDDLINLGRVKRTVKVVGHVINLATLTSLDYNKAMSRVPSEGNDSKRMEAMQREIVAMAIQDIDGKDLDQDKKLAILGLSQLGLSNLLYGQYAEMVDEQNSVIEEAKKNSLVAQAALTGSGKAPGSK